MRRLALSVAAATGLALTALAAPAQAAPEEETPLLGVIVPEQVAVIQGKSKTVRAEVINAGKVTAKNVVLKFSDVDAALNLTLPSECVDNACAVGTLRPGQRRTYSFTLKPTGTELTSTFDVSIASAGGLEGYGSPVTVVRSAGGVDLEVDPIDDLDLDRGETGTVPLVVRNTGTKPVQNVGVVLLAEAGLEALTKYRNCQAEEEDESVGGVVCVFDQTFEPGATFSLPADTPLQVKLAADAGGPYKYSAAVVAVGVSDDEIGEMTALSGPTLRLEEDDEAEEPDADEDINFDDNVASFGVSVGKSSADSAAIGATFTGKVGDTKTVEVGVRNLGPTALIPPGLDWFASVTVTVPTGVKLTKVDDACLPGDGTDFDLIKAGTLSGRTYTCLLVARLGKGDSELFSFTGTITKGDHEAGSVVADGGVQDPSKANNTAALTVDLAGGPGAPGDDDGGQGGGLPITGAPAGWIAAGGAALLLGGGVALLLVRRRRIVTVVD